MTTRRTRDVTMQFRIVHALAARFADVPEFTFDWVVSNTSCNKNVARHVVTRLIHADVIEIDKQNNRLGAKWLYRMKRKPSIHDLKPNRRRKATDKIWSAIKIRKRFSIADLVEITQCKYNQVQRYVRWLMMAGFVRNEVATKKGYIDGDSIYSIKRNLGMVAPIVIGQGGSVYDPNTNTEYEVRHVA